MSNQEKLVSVLNEKNLTLSVAESYTGGAIAKAIVSVSGASKVFYEGLVCYNVKSKTDRLFVNEETVKEYGVVSSKVAYEMALGLLKTNNCDVAIATTGYADKNDEDKIIGLGFIAVGYNGKIAVSKNIFDGDRERIIEKSSEKAIDMAIKILTEGDEVESEEQLDSSSLVENEEQAENVSLENNKQTDEEASFENDNVVQEEFSDVEEITAVDNVENNDVNDDLALESVVDDEKNEENILADDDNKDVVDTEEMVDNHEDEPCDYNSNCDAVENNEQNSSVNEEFSLDDL